METPTHSGTLSLLQVYSFSILGITSILSGIILLCAYLRVKRVKDKERSLILCICVSLTCISVLDCYSSMHALLFALPPSSDTCQIHGFLSIYFTFLYFNYGLSLSIAIICQSLRKKQIQQQSFHLFSQVMAVLISLTLLLGKAIGPSLVAFCFLSINTWGRFFLSALFVYSPVYLTAIFLSFSTQTWYSVYLTILLTLNLPLALVVVFREGDTWMEDIAVVLRSSQCFIICLLRMCEIVLNRTPRRWLGQSLLEPLKNRPSCESGITPRTSFSNTIEVDELKLMTALTGISYILNLDGDASQDETKEWMLDNCTLYEYAPFTFEKLRRKDNWTRGDLSSSLAPSLNKAAVKYFYQRDDTLIFCTHDRKLLLKEIAQEELEAFLQVLNRYFLHITQRSMNKSLLARVLGVFTIVQKEAWHFVVVQNIVSPEIINPVLFELKGRKLDQQVLMNPTISNLNQMKTNIIYKDLDFEQTQKTLSLSFSDLYWVTTVLKDDVDFLSDINSLEYSLFIAIGPTPVEKTHDLTPNYARHSYIGNGQDSDQIYVLGILSYLQFSEHFSPASREYARNFSNLITTISRCHLI